MRSKNSKNTVDIKVGVTSRLSRYEHIDVIEFERSIGLRWKTSFESKKKKHETFSNHYNVYHIIDPEKFMLAKLKYDELV
jgi:deoxycytidine triphosphate deaminase